jgi:AAA domain
MTTIPRGVSSNVVALLEQVHRRATRDRITRPLPPVRWLWHGLLAEHQLGMLHGMGGLSKSVLAQALAVEHIRGGYLLGRPVAAGRVVYLDAENDDRDTDDRLRRLGVGAGDDALAYHRVDTGILAVEEELLVEFLQHMAAENDASLLVLDSWSSIWGQDEVDHPLVQGFFNALNRVRQVAECSILLVHHDNRRGDYRGLAVIHNSVQSRLHVKPTREEDEDKTNITDITLWPRKQRSGVCLPKMPYTVEWEARRLGLTVNSVPQRMVELVVDHVTDAAGEVVPTTTMIEQFSLSKNWFNRHADQLHFCGIERDNEEQPRLSRGWRFRFPGDSGFSGGTDNHAGLRRSPDEPGNAGDRSTMRPSVVPSGAPLRGGLEPSRGNEIGGAR